MLKQRFIYDAYTRTFEDDVRQFETDKYNYETALTLEETRVNNIFALIFEPPVSVPSQPMVPTQPSPYRGLYLAYDATEFTAMSGEQNKT